MCDFCQKIYSNMNEYKTNYKSHWDEEVAIVKTENYRYGIYVPCDDYYYSGIALYDIKNCPYCGKKLKND